MGYGCQKDFHIEDFTRNVLRTAGGRSHPHFRKETGAEVELPRPPEMVQEMLLLSALGIAGEGGEVVDLIKKMIFHDKDFDTCRAKLLEEIGDQLFYTTLAIEALGSSYEEVCEINRRKLEKRYPKGFDTARANASRKP